MTAMAKTTHLLPTPAPRMTRRPASDFPEFIGQQKKCPHCGRVGDIIQDFGVRMINGKPKPASWCRVCRSAAVPRKGRPALTEAQVLAGKKRCPHCQKVKQGPEFGLRTEHGRRKLQAYCKPCRVIVNRRYG